MKPAPDTWINVNNSEHTLPKCMYTVYLPKYRLFCTQAEQYVEMVMTPAKTKYNNKLNH